MPTKRTTKLYRSRTPNSDGNSCPLDPNHTHFILLDDMLGENVQSTSGEIIQKVNCRADLTIKPRTEIEHAISKSESIWGHEYELDNFLDYAIPIVQILANGGASSVLTVCETLQQGTPVIVIEVTN
jgi:hypothetical protein